MPPPVSRFQSGPNTISPYHQQFGGHPSAQHPSLNGPSYLNPAAAAAAAAAAAQLNPFGGNGALSLAAAAAAVGGMNPGAGGFGGVGGDTGLASQAARMGFAHGAQLQQQQQQAQQAQQQQSHQQQQQQQQQLHHQQLQAHQQQQQQPQQQHHNHHPLHAALGEPHTTRMPAKGRIREVWKHNLVEEMAVIRDLVDRYPYIAMDTEFPGVVSRPMGSFRGKSDYHYQCLRTNVDLLKVIQIGITLFNEDGETPPPRAVSTDAADLGGPVGGRRLGAGNSALPYSWQFNFKFSLKDDMYNQTSIDSLVQAGIDFSIMDRDGIDPVDFAALLIPSGLVCFENVHWISFHGGYDFGYLTKLLHCKPLPSDEIEFDQIMKLYFPSTYDVKHLMKHAIRLLNAGQLTPGDPASTEVLQKFEHKSGLENIAEALKVKRVGAAHQAGSDSLLTGRVFFQMREKIFHGEIPDEQVGKVWGLMVPDVAPVPGLGGHLGFSTNRYGGGGGGGGLAGGVANNSGNNGGGGGGGMDSAADSASPGGGTNGGMNGASGVNGVSTNGGSGGGGGGAPSTPHTSSVGLVNTPAAGSHNTNSMGMGPMTPGGGGGVFGSFAFGGSR
ncbi:ccr4-not core complex subunit [Niveomyces insectorum RCEF 264]|uniref:poly(A)-specific ribonuclease n=1 Tax=Niveomyces insectorum RCEF 264 TaxID=1081102 RepID=A0A167M9Q5_9HYPO|nr:ccr4-not core complex subunit [Niveomyces insectorum RCEF 264]